MNNLDIRRYEMLARVREFGATYGHLFAPDTAGAHAFAAVAAATTELQQHAAVQLSGRGSVREGTTSKAVAREALREDLEAIIRTARALALDTPGLDDKFRAPRGSGDQTLLSAARAFARDAAPLTAAFVALDMPADFLEDLGRDIDEFEQAIREHDAGRGTYVAARASIEAALETGLAAVRRLDAIVPNRLRDEAATIAVWERARRVEYRGGRGRADATATGSQTPEPGPAVGATVAPAN